VRDCGCEPYTCSSQIQFILDIWLDQRYATPDDIFVHQRQWDLIDPTARKPCDRRTLERLHLEICPTPLCDHSELTMPLQVITCRHRLACPYKPSTLLLLYENFGMWPCETWASLTREKKLDPCIRNQFASATQLCRVAGFARRHGATAQQSLGHARNEYLARCGQSNVRRMLSSISKRYGTWSPSYSCSWFCEPSAAFGNHYRQTTPSASFAHTTLPSSFVQPHTE